MPTYAFLNSDKSIICVSDDESNKIKASASRTECYAVMNKINRLLKDNPECKSIKLESEDGMALCSAKLAAFIIKNLSHDIKILWRTSPTLMQEYWQKEVMALAYATSDKKQKRENLDEFLPPAKRTKTNNAEIKNLEEKITQLRQENQEKTEEIQNLLTQRQEMIDLYDTHLAALENALTQSIKIQQTQYAFMQHQQTTLNTVHAFFQQHLPPNQSGRVIHRPIPLRPKTN